MTKSSKKMINLEQAHLSLFIRCIEEVLVLTKHGAQTPRVDPGVILKTIKEHACQVYTCCLPQYKLEELAIACLSNEATKPSSRVKLQNLGVELSVPSQAVTSRMFQDHIKGVMDAEQPLNQQSIRYIYT